jgi:hypothetical protein
MRTLFIDTYLIAVGYFPQVVSELFVRHSKRSEESLWI